MEEKLKELMDVFCAYLRYINGFHYFTGGYCNGVEKRRDDKSIYMTFTFGREGKGEKKYSYDCWIAIEDLERNIPAKEMVDYITDGSGYDEQES